MGRLLGPSNTYGTGLIPRHGETRNNLPMNGDLPTRPGGLPYTDADRPKAEEPDRIAETETAWALFQELSAPPDTTFAVTQPVSLPMPLPLPKSDPRYASTVPSALTKPTPQLAQPSARSRQVSVSEVMNEARRNNRVCPQPLAWQKLYEMLPGKVQDERGWQPAPPLTGSAWSRTPSLAKRMCLRDHIEWAGHQGCLDEVFAFLKGLPDTDWHHLG
jgi:hypothetical protein